MRSALCIGALWLAALTAQAADPPVKIGGSMPLTGGFEGFGVEYSRGLELWADDVNKRGALLGRKVELVIYDDASDTSTVAPLYEKLITVDKVDVLVSPYSTPQTLEAAAVAERYGVPMVTVAAAPEVWSHGYANVFGVFTPANHYADPILDVAEAHNLTTVAIAYQQSDFPEAVAAGARVAAADRSMRVVFDEGYPEDTTDLNALVQRMVATEPEVVIVGSYLDDAIGFVRAAKAQGLEPEMLVFSGAPAVPEFGEALGADADGVLTVAQWMRSAHLPMSFDFAFRYDEHHGEYPSYHAAGGYGAGQILEAAVRLAGTTDHDAVRQQLATMHFRSILGFYRVEPSGAQAGKPAYLIQWQDGHRSLVYPPDIARWPLRYPFPAWSSR